MGTTRGIPYFLAAQSNQEPQAQEAATKRKATRLRPFFCSFVDGMKYPENSRRNKILWMEFESLKQIETKHSQSSVN
jgi:hypothetical protein